MNSAAILLSLAVVTFALPPATASVSTAIPTQKTKVAKKRTAKVRSLRYHEKARAYVLRASIALPVLQRPAAERAKTVLSAKLTYTQGGAARTAQASVKLSGIKVVSKDKSQGIAIVELRILGSKADDKGAIKTSVELVGANPTPHP